jgi:hypothetical protein
MRLHELLDERKKDRRAIKHSIKPRNPVAHAAQTVAKGSGPHKDKKKAAKQGDVKHKNKIDEFKLANVINLNPFVHIPSATEAKLWAAIMGMIPATRKFAPILSTIATKHPDKLADPSWLQKVTGLDSALNKALTWVEDNPDHPAVMKLKNELEKKTTQDD